MSVALPQPRRRGLQSFAPMFVGLFERYMPDSFVLATGHAPVVARPLRRLVSMARTPNQAVMLTFLVAAAASSPN